MAKKRDNALLDETRLSNLEKRLGYAFKDRSLLIEALTHKSYAQVERSPSLRHNERLEFLGDAVLSIVSAEELFTQMPNADEGTLTVLRAAYVCEAHLTKAALSLGLGEFLRLSPSVSAQSLERTSLLADAVEALLGAIYLDSDLKAVQRLAKEVLGPVPKRVEATPKDAKTELQEWVQAHSAKTPTYTVVKAEGPAHAPIFQVSVCVDGKVLATGEGPSKKDAAQEAARIALARLHASA